MSRSIQIIVRIIALAFCLSLFVTQSALAQGSSFTYQGALNNNNVPGNGNFDFEFKLFDALNGGIQQGAAVQRLNVPVTNGIFTVTLDFGAAVFTGAARFLEISVRSAGVGVFTLLTPRQQITATPYAIKAANAGAADSLSAACVGCVTSTQIQGGGAYINNTTTQQAGANFNIGGNGTVGGNLIANGNVGIGTTTPTYKLDVAGNLRAAGSSSNDVQVETAGGTNAWARFNMKTANQTWSLGTSQNFNGDQFYLYDFTHGQRRMTIQPNGGTISFPSNNSNDVQVETAGGTNAWARFNLKTTNQTWSLGTSQNFNGDQFYLYDFTFGQRRLTVQPNGGMVSFPNSNSNDVQVETAGGTNAWARFNMKTPNQTWTLGTSRDFNGDQFYLYDFTHSQFVMTAQPRGGAISFPNANVGIGTFNTLETKFS